MEDLPPSVVDYLVLRGHLCEGDTRMRAVSLAGTASAGIGLAVSDAERQVPSMKAHVEVLKACA